MRRTRPCTGRTGGVVVFGAIALSLLGTPRDGDAVDETVTVFGYTGPAVPTIAFGTVSATIDVAGLGSATDVDLRFDGITCTNAFDATAVGLTHPWIRELAISLTSPSGTRVQITRSGNLADGRNLCLTTFTDEAAFPFGDDSTLAGPYAGRWRPAEPLSVFDGESPNGTWTLSVANELEGEVGVLRAFSLLISTAGAPAVTPQPFEYTYANPSGDALRNGPIPQRALATVDVDAVAHIDDLDVSFDGSQCSSAVDATEVGLSTQRVGDLTITLTSPSNHTVTLLSALPYGLDGSNLCQTVFDDEAFFQLGAPAAGAVSPYSGRYQPLGHFSEFDGGDGAGQWILAITDDLASPVPTPSVLRAFSLVINDGGTTVAVPFEGDPVEISEPAPVPDLFPVQVDATGTIADIDLRIDGAVCNQDSRSTTNGINLWRNSSLDLRLTSPAGTTVQLMQPAGANWQFEGGSHLCMTRFTDDGPVTVDDRGYSPYSGLYRPHEPLSAFNGEDAAGTWTLSVADVYGDQPEFDGSLTGFTLLVTTGLTAPPTTAAPTTVGSGATLPRTGGHTGGQTVAALWVAALGALLVAAATRRSAGGDERRPSGNRR